MSFHVLALHLETCIMCMSSRFLRYVSLSLVIYVGTAYKFNVKYSYQNSNEGRDKEIFMQITIKMLNGTSRSSILINKSK